MAPPLHALRRGIAYTLDWIIVWIGFGFALSLFGQEEFDSLILDPKVQYGVGLNFAVSSFEPPLYAGSTTCGAAGPVLLELAQSAVVEDAVMTGVTACFERKFGRTVSGAMFLELAPEASTTTAVLPSTTIPLNPTGFLHRWAEPVVLTAFILLSALCLRLLRTTPGKFLVGLQFASGLPRNPLRREVVKNIPHLVSAVALVAIGSAGLSEAIGNILGWGVFVVAAVLILILWVKPLFDEARVMPRDRGSLGPERSRRLWPAMTSDT